MSDSFTAWFNERLKTTKTTRYKITKDTGITDRTMQQWTKGIVCPRLDNAEIIADYFGYEIKFIKKGETI